jgi:hypothetical protein
MMSFLSLAIIAQVGRPLPAPAPSAAAQSMLFTIQMIFLALNIGTIVGMWAVFEKAGEPGWQAIIPIWNFIILLRIAGKPWWYILLLLIPCVGIVAAIVIQVQICMEISSRFGQGGGVAVGLFFLPFVFYPILGFGSAQWGGRRRKGKKKRRRVEEFEDDYEEEDDYEPAPRARRRRPTDDEDEYEEEQDEGPPPAPVRRRPPAEDEEAEDRITAPTGRVRPSPGPARAVPSKVGCPECGTMLKLPPNLESGKRIKCPKCRHIFPVP